MSKSVATLVDTLSGLKLEPHDRTALYEMILLIARHLEDSDSQMISSTMMFQLASPHVAVPLSSFIFSLGVECSWVDQSKLLAQALFKDHISCKVALAVAAAAVFQLDPELTKDQAPVGSRWANDPDDNMKVAYDELFSNANKVGPVQQ